MRLPTSILALAIITLGANTPPAFAAPNILGNKTGSIGIWVKRPGHRETGLCVAYNPKTGRLGTNNREFRTIKLLPGGVLDLPNGPRPRGKREALHLRLYPGGRAKAFAGTNYPNWTWRAVPCSKGGLQRALRNAR